MSADLAVAVHSQCLPYFFGYIFGHMSQTITNILTGFLVGRPKDIEPHCGGSGHPLQPRLQEEVRVPQVSAEKALQRPQQARHQGAEGPPPRRLIQVHHEQRAQRRRPQN